MRLLHLVLPVLLTSACITGGIELDDTGGADADSDTDADTDTDTDADTDIEGNWAGTIHMGFVDGGMPLCEGELDLIVASPELTGQGTCVLIDGPGAGMEMGVELEGGEGEGGSLSAQLIMTMPDMPDESPPVSCEGTIDADSLSLSFAFEAPSPENPQEMVAIEGGIEGSPID